jgi:hypothetical protein
MGAELCKRLGPGVKEGPGVKGQRAPFAYAMMYPTIKIPISTAITIAIRGWCSFIHFQSSLVGPPRTMMSSLVLEQRKVAARRVSKCSHNDAWTDGTDPRCLSGSAR